MPPAPSIALDAAAVGQCAREARESVRAIRLVQSALHPAGVLRSANVRPTIARVEDRLRGRRQCYGVGTPV